MPKYASTTSVSTETSLSEIQRNVRRWGADEFGFATTGSKVQVMFTVRNRRVRFSVDLPSANDPEFKLTPSTRKPRTATAAYEAWEQACRQRYRALSLIIKAKLEAVEAEIVTFEEEFAMHMVLPGTNFTVAEAIGPGLQHAFETGDAGAVLAIGRGS